MQFETIRDLHITVPYLRDAELQRILALLNARREALIYQDYQYEEEHGYSHNITMHHILLKDLWEYDFKCVQDVLRDIKKARMTEEELAKTRYISARDLYKAVQFCQRFGCFEPTVQDDLPKEQRFHIFDRHGESLHEIDLYCWKHVSVSRKVIHHMLRTMQEKMLVEGKYWTKILSWQTKSGKYFAQLVCHDQEGDWETGYFDSTTADPWQGPHKTREAAIEAAEAYEG